MIKMSKRGENIRKRKDGRWEARIKQIDGTLHSTYARSYNELKEKIRGMATPPKRTEDETQEHKNSQETPFCKVCNDWLKETAIKNKQSTVARYQFLIQKHLLPFFEQTKITNESATTFILYKLHHEKLSSKTVYDMVTVLIQIIKYAQTRGFLQPFGDDIIRPKVTRTQFQILTVQEQERLVKSMKDDITHENIGVFLALFCGMRLGEICALQVQDIKTMLKSISVTKSMQRVAVTDETSDRKTAVIIDTPKSQKSVRDIPIPDFLIPDLERLTKNCPADAFVLTGTPDRFIEPRLYQYKFKKYLEKANVRNVNFHALRHTFATRAVEQNMDIKALSEILGHEKVSFTLERYVQLSFAFKKENMEKLKVCY